MVTTIDSVRKKHAAARKDAARLYMLGRGFGRSIELLASPENLEAIQAGPAYLREAADYYEIAVGDEKDFVIQNFHEGVRQYRNIGMYQIAEMFWDLRKSQS